MAVGHGETVPANGPLWPGTAMCRFLVLRPIGEIISPLELPDGMHVEFMQAIPIFESEFAAKPGAVLRSCLRIGRSQGWLSGTLGDSQNLLLPEHFVRMHSAWPAA